MTHAPVSRGTVLRPLVYPWFRGAATRDRDEIVMNGRRAERYQPLLEPRIGIELARVRTPDDAVAFVGRFGMLNQSAAEGERCPTELRQPFAEFERAAEDLRSILRTVFDVRKAAAGGRTALARVRARFAPPDPDAELRVETTAGGETIKARHLHPPAYFDQSDRAILIRAGAWAAAGLLNGLGDARRAPSESACSRRRSSASVISTSPTCSRMNPSPPATSAVSPS
jgi:hypothetical protein